MFIIAGISPKTIVLDTVPRRCALCGMNKVYLKRVDHYLSLFFIPLIRVKKSAPMVICDSCSGRPFQTRRNNDSESAWKGRQCQNCGKTLKGDFEYCPYCGKKI